MNFISDNMKQKWKPTQYVEISMHEIFAFQDRLDAVRDDPEKVWDVVNDFFMECENQLELSPNFLKELQEIDDSNSVPISLGEIDELFEDDVNESAEDKKMTEEELKIESLKIATNIAKLMSDVTTDDIITIADKVSGFIRDHQIGSEETKSEESDIAADLELPSDEESSEEKPEESSEENKEETEA